MFKKLQPIVNVIKPGLIPFDVGIQLQKLLSNQNAEDVTNFHNYLIMQEHYPVYTIGIRSKNYTKQDEENLRSFGAEFYHTNRGGLITFHGPGQLVAYPILHLKQFQPKIRWYIKTLEQWVIDTCTRMGISNAVRTEHTGIWVNDKKICAIGVHGSRYITTHGVGLNCCTDMQWFEHIIPCGIEGKGVTSLSEQLKRKVTVEETAKIALEVFQQSFHCHVRNEADNILEIKEKNYLHFSIFKSHLKA